METVQVVADLVSETKPGEAETKPVVPVEAEVTTAPVKAKENEYAYLDSTGFTSERFKIEIRNLPKYYGIAVSFKIDMFSLLIWLIVLK